MNKLWLEYFCTIAEYGSITRAAQSLNISQSSLSQTVAKLEQQLGVKLIERVSRGIELTRQGKLFLDYAHETLLREKAIRQELLDMGSEPVGTILMGVCGRSAPVAVDLFLQFQKLYPKVDITFHQSTASDYTAGNNNFDLLLTSLPIDEEKMDTRDIMTNEFLMMLPQNHPLAKQHSVRLDSFAKERFVIPGRNVEIVRHFCALGGFQPDILVCDLPLDITERTVASGNAVAMVQASWNALFADPESSGVVVLPIEYPVCRRPIRLAWIKDQYLSKAARLFRDYLIEHYVEHYRELLR